MTDTYQSMCEGCLPHNYRTLALVIGKESMLKQCNVTTLNDSSYVNNNTIKDIPNQGQYSEADLNVFL